ncbi:MAG: hypothetical protein HOF85_00170, partial [Acidiferrobacteraceae bacterium]|nr:hypothetical protein [Acidiferrobacteraceae bacterium]
SSDTEDSAKNSGRISEKYSFFFSQGDHLERLFSKENYDDAVTLYEEQQIYFTKSENRKKYLTTLNALASNYNDPISDQVDAKIKAFESISAPQNRDGWPKTKELLDATRTIIGNYPNKVFFKDAEYRLPTIDTLKSKFDAAEGALKLGAHKVLSTYDIFDDQPFFDVYPVALEPKTALSNNFDALSGKLALIIHDSCIVFKGHAPSAGFTDEFGSEFG